MIGALIALPIGILLVRLLAGAVPSRCRRDDVERLQAAGLTDET